MITWLASYPRAGNTLYRMWLYYTQGIETYSVYPDRDIVGMGAASTVGHSVLPYSLAECKGTSKMYFIKTHELPDSHDYSPAIYIVRDGRDTLVSYAHYLQDVDGLAIDFEAILTRLIVEGQWGSWGESHGPGGWSEHVTAWGRRDGTSIVRFESLVEHTPAAGQLPAFEDLRRQWPAFFRKGKAGGWRDDMSPFLEELFWAHHGQAMEALGYTR